MKKIFNKIWSNGPLLIIIAASLWAIDGIIRRSLYVLPPINIVFFEHLIGSIIILPFFLKDLGHEKLTSKSFSAIFFVSLLSSLLGTLWFTTALLKTNYISFSVVYLLQKLQPLFAIITARILLKEKITKKYIIFGGLAIIAAYFVTFKNGIINLKTGAVTIEAALYAVGAAFAWGTTTAFSRYAVLKTDSRFMTGLRFFITTVLALITVFIFHTQKLLPAISLSQILRFILIALTTGMVGILIYYRGLKFTQVKVSTILELVYPVLAVVIDMVLYKSFLSPTQIIAAIALFFYVFKISKLNSSS